MPDQHRQKHQSCESGHAVDHEKTQKFSLSQLGRKTPSQLARLRRQPPLDQLTPPVLLHLRQRPENNPSDLIVVRILDCCYTGWTQLLQKGLAIPWFANTSRATSSISQVIKFSSSYNAPLYYTNTLDVRRMERESSFTPSTIG